MGTADNSTNKQSGKGGMYDLNLDSNLNVDAEEFDITPILPFQEFNNNSRSLDDIRNAFACGFFHGSEEDENDSSSSVGSTEAFDNDTGRDEEDDLELDFLLDETNKEHGIKNDDDDDHSLCSQSYIRSGMMSNDSCDFVDGVDETIPTNQEGSHRRKVRFDTDVDGKVKCQAWDAVEPVRTPDIKKCYWYNKSDYKRFREESHKHAGKALRSNYAKEFYQVFQACESSKTWNTLNANHSIRLAGSKYRGSEQYIFGALLIPIRRRIHLEILNMQKAWIHAKKNNLQNPKVPQAVIEEQSVEKLGALARSLTERSRRLALLLGQGDAMLAPHSHPISPLRGMGSPFRPLAGTNGGPRKIISKMGIVGRRRKKTGGISVGIEV
jgi:hypothetical protein